ncbi:MAG: PKD domain-containing protein, partial [Flavipsychrobacter sp.]
MGNGTTSTLQNPSTTYFTAGTYAVKLVVTNASGRDSVTKTNYITVAPTPIVSFTADSTPSCTLPRTVTFNNTSSPGGSGTTTYLWDFGDGTTSTAQNPSKTYT